MAYIDIDIIDILESSSLRELKEVHEWMQDNYDDYPAVNNKPIPFDDTWNDSVAKLIDRRYLLTKEQENTILQIVNLLP